MALGKILNLGGIENSSPRADQSANGFRIARNILPTPDGSIIPRYHWQEPEGQPSGIKNICNIAQYNEDALVLAEKQEFFGADSTFELYKNSSKVPLNSYIGIAPEVPFGGMDIQQSYRFNNTVYYLNPYGGSLFKYDGVELGYAGCNQPLFSTSGYLGTGTRFIKVIQHTFDFDNNEPVSEYVQFPTSSTNVLIQSNNSIPSGFTYMPSTNTGVVPTTQISSQGYNGNYFLGSVKYDSLNQSYIVTSNPVRVGTNSLGTSITVPQIVTSRSGTFTAGSNLVSVPSIVTARSGTAVSAGPTISSISFTSDLKVGMRVFGATIIVPTFIKAILSSTSILVTSNIPAGTQTISFSDLNIGMQVFNTTAVGPVFIDSVNSATSITISSLLVPAGTRTISFSDLQAGTSVFGTDIPSGTVISSITSATVFVVNNVVPSGSRDLYFEYNNTNITSDRIGSYVFVAATQEEMKSMGFLSLERGLALKVKSVSPLTLDALDARVLPESRDWYVFQSALASLEPYINYGTRTFFTYWESASVDGVFFYRKISPSFPNNTFSTDSFPIRQILTTTGTALATDGSSTTMFLISPILNDWYNVNTKKISPNMLYPFGIGEFHALTKYQDLLVVANDQLIWFSDTSLGGWTEQFESGNNILIGDMQYGRITSICGTGDFLFVGRERKNYYVNGNIATGNYRVQEISDVQVGPWNNASCVQIKDSVVFLNSLGIFSVSQGGTVSELSKKCKKNFDSFNPINIDEDVVFRMTGTSSTLSTVGISAAFDEYRQLLVFMKRQEGNPCLVLDTSNGEIYEWNGLYSPGSGVYANCIQFIYGKYYVGGIDPSFDPLSYTSLAKYAVESFASSRSYVTSNPVKLYTTWLTSGEPSLEKEILQLKMFGRISAPTTGLKVKHYKDWDKDTAITNSEYFPISPSLSVSNQIQFSHKKRLNSDKCLCASVGIELNDPTTDFEIESFELEFNSIQSGMKR